jgi:HAD superfamily PSPase-like hydrolase
MIEDLIPGGGAMRSRGMNNIRLVCFDLDGTIIDDTVFVWETIHDFLATSEEAREKARDDYFAGRITYPEWADHDLKLWKEKGATRAVIEEAIRPIRLVPGVREALGALKSAGLILTVISGSIDIALSKVLPDYESFFDDVFVNRLIFGETGEVLGIIPNPYDIEKKGDGLKFLAGKHGVPLEACAFVGDHFNDISAAEIAGLSIAFNCKSDDLSRVSDVVIERKDMKEILKVLLPGG